jgi:hypothetical protein
MFDPTLFAMIAFATCFVNFAHAGGRYINIGDYPAGTVTAGGFGVWDDGSAPATNYLEEGLKAFSAGGTVIRDKRALSRGLDSISVSKKKRGLKYSKKKRAVLPVVGDTNVLDSVIVPSGYSKQKETGSSKGQANSKSKRDVLDCVNTLVAGTTVKSATDASGGKKGLVNSLVPGNKGHGCEKVKRETGLQETASTMGKDILVFYPEAIRKKDAGSIVTAD